MDWLKPAGAQGRSIDFSPARTSLGTPEGPTAAHQEILGGRARERPTGGRDGMTLQRALAFVKRTKDDLELRAWVKLVSCKNRWRQFKQTLRRMRTRVRRPLAGLLLKVRMIQGGITQKKRDAVRKVLPGRCSRCMCRSPWGSWYDGQGNRSVQLPDVAHPWWSGSTEPELLFMRRARHARTWMESYTWHRQEEGVFGNNTDIGECANCKYWEEQTHGEGTRCRRVCRPGRWRRDRFRWRT